MQQRPTVFVLRSLLLTVMMAGVMPATIAHAQGDVASASLPDAPIPQQNLPAPPASTSTLPSSTQEQKESGQPDSNDALRRAEKQRAFGVMPMFQLVNGSANIPPLRPKQKFQLMAKSTTDPFVFALVGVISGIGQARNTNTGTKTVTNPDGTTSIVPWGFGQGAAGYFKRFGAGYADTADGNFWGNAVLPVLLKEDPRYFRMGSGYSFIRRFGYSASTALWCRRDNGKWGPNYANVAGNFISGGISNLYYPDENTGFEKTVIGAMTVTAEGVIGAELIEFLPDIQHHFTKNRQKKLAATTTP
jgi:hypothetical protein